MLKKAMKKKKLNAVDLASKLNASPMVVRNWVQKLNTPSLAYALKIKKILGSEITLEGLLAAKGKKIFNKK